MYDMAMMATTTGDVLMPRYIIERDIPKFGLSEQSAFREGAQTSNNALTEMRAEKKNIQWEHTYDADNKTFCIYLADNEGLIHEHAQRSGFPMNKITEIRRIIDPVAGEGE
jgi:hypothetical protein